MDSKDNKPEVGIKHDQDKPDLTLIPKEALWEMGLALTYGGKKYGRYNYRAGLHITRQLAAAMRHIAQFIDGENFDTESGHSHLGHALASLAMATYTLKNKPEFDDRYKRPTDNKVIDISHNYKMFYTEEQGYRLECLIGDSITYRYKNENLKSHRTMTKLQIFSHDLVYLKLNDLVLLDVENGIK